MKFETGQTSSNNFQQVATTWCANARNMLGPTMLRLVGQQCCERLHGPLLCSHCGWLLLKCSTIGIGFNGAETNCRIAHILGILLMNSCNTDIFFSNYYHLQSVRFELQIPPESARKLSRNIPLDPLVSHDDCSAVILESDILQL